MSKKAAPEAPALTVSEIRSDSLLVEGNPVQIGVLADGTLVALNASNGLPLTTEAD